MFNDSIKKMVITKIDKVQDGFHRLGNHPELQDPHLPRTELFLRKYLIDKTVLNRLRCGEEVVTVCVLHDAFSCLTSMKCKNIIDAAAQAQDFACSNFNVSSLTFCSTKWLVNEYCRVREAEALALLTCSKKYRTHTHRHTYTYCRNIWLDPLHSIVDSQTSIDHSTWRVDIQVDILGCILTLEEKQLCYSEVGNIIIDWCANK